MRPLVVDRDRQEVNSSRSYLDELKVLAARIGSAGVLALLASAGEQALGDGKWRKLRVYWRRGGWPARRAVDGIRRMEGGGTAAAGGRERSGASLRKDDSRVTHPKPAPGEDPTHPSPIAVKTHSNPYQ